jgi:penicillin-binding protein 1A
VSRPFRISLWIAGLLALLLVASPFVAYHAARWYYDPELPSVATLKELKLQVPLRVYTRDGRLIGEFGAERRAPMRYEQIPQRVIDAFLASEDDRFFEHPGVDWQGLVRAAQAGHPSYCGRVGSSGSQRTARSRRTPCRPILRSLRRNA